MGSCQHAGLSPGKCRGCCSCGGDGNDCGEREEATLASSRRSASPGPGGSAAADVLSRSGGGCEGREGLGGVSSAGAAAAGGGGSGGRRTAAAHGLAAARIGRRRVCGQGGCDVGRRAWSVPVLAGGCRWLRHRRPARSQSSADDRVARRRDGRSGAACAAAADARPAQPVPRRAAARAQRQAAQPAAAAAAPELQQPVRASALA